MNKFKEQVLLSLGMPNNNFHPLVHILGEPEIGKGTYIGLYSEINANKALVKIGVNCDIASFVAINCADSHKMTIEKKTTIDRGNIIIEDNVFRTLDLDDYGTILNYYPKDFIEQPAEEMRAIVEAQIRKRNAND